jgi:hypothetical protein
MNETTLLHSINPEDFYSRLKEIVKETINTMSQQFIKDNSDELWTVEETAQYFKKSKDTIENWTNKGYLIKHLIGNSVYYKPTEVKNALVPMRANKHH